MLMPPFPGLSNVEHLGGRIKPVKYNLALTTLRNLSEENG
jgi:hypothetical protein